MENTKDYKQVIREEELVLREVNFYLKKLLLNKAIKDEYYIDVLNSSMDIDKKVKELYELKK